MALNVTEPLLYGDVPSDNDGNFSDKEGGLSPLHVKRHYFPDPPSATAHACNTVDTNAEDTASFLSLMSYSWLTPTIALAANEQLTLAAFGTAKNSAQDSSALCAARLFDDFSEEQRKAHTWDCFINDDANPVRRCDDPTSRGTIRWIGSLQQSDRPLQIVVAVDWTHAPEQYARDPTIAFTDGVVDGERLFTCSSPTATLELPSSLQLVKSVDEPPRPRTPSLPWSCLRSSGDRMVAAVACLYVQKLFIYATPLLQQQFIQYLSRTGVSSEWSSRDECLWGTSLAVLLVLAALMRCILWQKFLHLGRRCGYHAQFGTTAFILHKALTMSKKASTDPRFSAGRIFNLISNDCGDVEGVFTTGPELSTVPVDCIVSVVLIYSLVGYAGFAGVVSLLICMPFQAKILSGMDAAQTSLSAARDKRLRATNELITGIRVIKAMGWESNFINRILALRDVELAKLKRTQRLDIATAIFEELLPAVLCVSVFTTYYLLGHSLTPDVMFPALTVLGMLQDSLAQLPQIYTYVINARVSFRRLDRYLSAADEVHVAAASDENDRALLALDGVDVVAFTAKKITERRPSSPPLIPCCNACFGTPDEPQQVTVNVDDKATEGEDDLDSDDGANEAAHEDDDDDGSPQYYSIEAVPLLRDVTLRIPKGKLTVVVGPTGAGKTTLLESFLGDGTIANGTVMSVPSIAYVPQKSWIMNATVRDNIVFFEESSESSMVDAVNRRLKRALTASCLDADLDQLPQGLQTELGEKGVNLSGGQRARVALARAVYADRDVYLLDDPLAAVDVHVGRHIVEHCITGALRRKTRVLVTHQAHVVALADAVLAVDGGRVVFQGTPKQYDEWIANSEAPDATTDDDHQGMSARQVSSVSNDRMSRFPTRDSEKTTGSNADDDDTTGDPATERKPTAFMTVEEKAEGAVAWSTYRAYLRACGRHTALVVLTLFTSAQFVYSGIMIWFALWTAKTFDLSEVTYLYVFAALEVLAVCCGPLNFAVLLAYGREGSRVLHADLLRSIASGTQTFFDTTPVGRIVNRFSSDMETIDGTLPLQFVGCLDSAFQTLGSVVVVLISQPFIAIVIVPIGFAVRQVLKFYSAANREVRRLVNLARSPVTALASEILEGSRTLASYQKQEAVMREGARRLDIYFGASFLEMLLYRWIGFRLEMPAVIIITLIVAVAVVLKAEDWHTMMSVSVTGLALSLATNASSAAVWLVRDAADVEAEMNSVERVLHYTQSIATERVGLDCPAKKDTQRPPTVTLRLDGVVAKYRPELDPVLKGLSLQVQPRQKVGIVGRTGSGKSTLLQVLLRLIDIDAGTITINGVSHTDMSLSDLRDMFAVIPQDPVLFRGTVRSNLDPFREHNDADVTAALDATGMSTRVQDAGGLSAPVTEGGSNFSVGQRQLLCVARAMLKRRASIVLLDEATANIDPTTDEILQRTIRSAFADRIVLTVAHRLGTVMDYDVIVVMDSGVAVEVGSPSELLSQTSSVFRAMVDAARSHEGPHA